MIGSRRALCFLVAAPLAAYGCSSEPQPAPAPANTAGSGAGGGSGGAAGAGGSTAPSAGSGGGGAAGSAGSGGAGTGGLGGGAGSAGSGGAAGSAGSGGGGGLGGFVNVAPTCITMDVQDGIDRAADNYIECDVEAQAIDFDVAENYAAERDPGYDPALTTVSFTDFGTAFTGFAVQECHPYCYEGNLTLGVTFAAAAAQSVTGEVLFAFPAGVAPIANAVGRLSLGWVFVDGPALPGGATLTGEMVLKSADNGILVANSGSVDLTPGSWKEFKYFPIEQGFAAADLTNIEAIGFRITLSQAGDWQGVIYADHFQLRQ